MEVYESTGTHFEIDHGCWPDGVAVHSADEPGYVVVRVRPGHITDELCRELNELHAHILGTGLWVQRWDPEAEDLASQTDPCGKACVRWERVAEDELPLGALCVPVERAGSFVWLVHRDHATEEFCAGMNDYLDRVVGRGWVQRWQPPKAA
ncbi:hypothetical protein [Streptomyces sp. ODS28]|uniref:hypothetical protein n=1 Tax=Streptomyces sp. ODS28 TaxID=3136688 RepID=UPI0031EB4232